MKMDSKYIVPAAAVGFLVVLGLVGWLIFGSAGGPSGPSGSESASSEPFRGPPPSTAPDLSPTRKPGEKLAFAFQRLAIDTSAERPEACLVFSEELDATGKVNYADYLKIEPGVAFSVRATGAALCLAGLNYAEKYIVTVMAGLPSAGGATLAVEERVPVELTDRPPAIAFGGGIILPRDSEGRVPVTTVNVSELDVRVLRVGDRLLSQLYEGLVDSQELYSYDTYGIEEQMGALVWKGTMAVEGAKNATITTLIPLREAVAAKKPGVYLILASDAKDKDRIDYYWGGTAAQWVIDTDIGLTSFRGADGLHVYARAYSSAAPIAGIEVALVARNNEELGRVRTDSDGKAHFNAELLKGTGGNEPVVVMAYGQDGDFAYLDLRRPAFDLSDRGVSGRPAPGPIDAFLYTDRGIYRPGESVHVAALLRNTVADAVKGAPVTMVAWRPDGIEYRRVTVNEAGAGGYAHEFAISATAPRGRWSVSAYVDPKGAALGRVSFDVQDFVPERLKVTLTPRQAKIVPGEAFEVDIEGRYLYGAPASGLAGEGEMRLTVDPDPYPAFEGYQFGRVEERFQDLILPLEVTPTDDNGKATAAGFVELASPTTHPVRAYLSVGLFEPGGRQTREALSVPVRTGDLAIGIRPAFEEGWVREQTPAEFEVLAIGADGKAVARQGLAYRLVYEAVNYHWYEMDGRWLYDRQVRDIPVEDGTLDTAPDAPAKVAKALDWGSYRLIVSDNQSNAQSSVQFWVGWGGSVGADRPDRVAVTLDKSTYKPGENAVINVRPPSAGKVMIAIASDRIHMTRMMDVSDEGGTLTIPVDAAWGPGAYALVTHYRALSGGNPRSPVRSIGLAYLSIDAAAKTLAVSLGAPEVVKPQGKAVVPISVEGAKGDTFVTLAAVDEGILQLTDFKSPDPVDHYFGKRRLGLDIRDDYGRLIEAMDGAVGQLRSGGDGFAGGEGLQVVPTRSVALFSGIVKLNGSGKGEISLDIPDFVGELRLMAVAFNAGQVGKAEAAMKVRDVVVADLTLPRFLAPGDAGNATLLVDNVEGPAGSYGVSVTTTGALAQDTSNFNFDLTTGAKQVVLVPIKAGETGIGTVSLTLQGPQGVALARSWPIEVRPGQRPFTTETIAKLAPGESLTLASAMFEGLLPGTGKMSVSLASSRGYDVPGLLRWLDRYPYGCLEQTTSRAYPLLVYNEVAERAGLAGDKGLKVRIQDAVYGVLDMQSPGGNFGMWGWGRDAANDWLSVYAIDFLQEAKARDYVVPQDALNRSRDWLRGTAAQSYQAHETRSYAMYVLARLGAVNLPDLRYYHDTEIANIKSAIAAAHLGAALAELGDRSRAHSAFAKAVKIATQPMKPSDIPVYGSELRDLAATTALAARAKEVDLLPALFERAAELKSAPEDTTTQEKAWMLLAANALQESQGPLSVEVKGVAASGKGPVYLASIKPGEADGVSVRNTGDSEVWYTISVEGISASPLPAEAKGVSASKTYYRPDGSLADLGALRQSEKVIVVISGTMPDIRRREMAVMDLLPAGLEIEAPLSQGTETQYPFLPALSWTSLQQKRDDRFVATFTIEGSRRQLPNGEYTNIIPDYAVAYIARAVTPGSYTLPAATIEDMYAPGVKARTDMATLSVLPAGQ